MTVPDWIQDAIFYQIFPDRFANGDLANDPPNRQAWGEKPDLWGFQGGDLRGIIEKLDYLLDLGVTALWLNPIFLSPSNHRYNTIDYYRIDPRLGDLSDFQALLKAAHSNGLRVILDGVFNHCSRGFFAFVDVLENGERSAYLDWFHIRRFPLDAYSYGPAENYLGWWGFKSLPKFNTDNQAVRRFLLDVGRYWIEQGADGWRLDVPNEIDDDPFWAEFRQTVRAANPEAYLMGEIWNADPRWVGPEHFDGLMNYPLRDALLGFLEGGAFTAAQLSARVEDLLTMYPRENVYAMYLTLGTHDTERVCTVLNGRLDKARQAYAFLFAFPGAPAIYYGDEIGLTGGKDPASRGAFPWDERQWNTELRRWIQALIAMRKSIPALRRGRYLPLLADNRSSCFAFARRLADQAVLVALNASPVTRLLRIPVAGLGWEEGRAVRSLLGLEAYQVLGGAVEVALPPWGAVWIG